MRVPLASFVIVVALFAAAPASAATFVVNSTGDQDDFVSGHGDGNCNVNSSGTPVCTLRAAITESNSFAGSDIIQIPAMTITRPVGGATNEESNANGDFDVTSNVTITGAGVGQTFIDANHVERVFDVKSPNGDLTLQDMTVENGQIDSFNGGGILNAGSVTLDHVVLTGNTSSGGTNGGNGGGVFSSGSLSVTDSEISANHAAGTWPSGGFGGGIYNNNGALSLNRALVSGNSALKAGGGLLQAAQSAGITSSTFSTNSAGTGGGAIATGTPSTFSWAATITWSTIVHNSSTTGSGAIQRFDTNGVPFEIGSSIIALNTSGDSSPQCGSTAEITSDGNNIVGDGSCSAIATGDQPNTDPQLGPLQDNGGPTFTYLPNPGSPAIDKGSPDDCPLVDQRGVARPIGSVCDVGAVEAPLPSSPPPPPPPTQPSPSKVVVAPADVTRKPGDNNTILATVTRTDGSAAANTQLRYVITGANPGTGLVTTDVSGNAAIGWDGVHDGDDKLTAYVDLNGNGAPDFGEPAAAATVHWVLPTPVIARTVNLEPLSGKVLVKLPSPATGKVSAAASYIPLSEAMNVPIGSIVDARKGHVELSSAVKKGSTKTQSVEFYSGAFEMTQTRNSPYMQVGLSEGLICPKSGKGKVTAARAKSRHLWGKDKGGRFRTRGRHSTATVRGTTWFTKDTCSTTTTVVREGSVIVTDFAKHKHVKVKAGHRYVARAKKQKSRRH